MSHKSKNYYGQLNLALGLKLKVLLIFTILLSLTNCGYYTKDTYFGPKDSKGWDTSWGNNKESKASCSNMHVKYKTYSFDSYLIAHSFVSIPIIPGHQVKTKHDINQPIIIDINFSGDEAICDINDIRIKLNNGSMNISPKEKNAHYYVYSDKTYYCRYWFNEKYSEASKIYVQISPEKTGCKIDPLELEVMSSWQYHNDPW